MSGLKKELLDVLDDHELRTLCRFSDLDNLVRPIKENPKFYSDISRKIGNKPSKNSALVQKFMPRFAVELFHKNDMIYDKIIVGIATQYKVDFEKNFEEITGESISELSSYSDEKLVALYFDIKDKFRVEINARMFCILLKLNKLPYDNDQIEKIKLQIEDKIKYYEEIEDIVSKRVEEITKEYKSEKVSILKEKKEVEKNLSEASRIIKEKDIKISDLQKKINTEHDALVAKWNKELEESIKNKKKEQESSLKEEYDEKRKKMLADLEDEKTKKLQDLSEEISRKNKEFSEGFTKRENELNSNIKKLTKKKEELEEKIDSISKVISSLDSEMKEKEQALHNMSIYEDKYFEEFDQRIVNRRIDSLISKKLIELDNCNNIKRESNKMNYRITNPYELTDDIVVNEESDSILDFVDELSDNISSRYSSSSEIAGIITAAYLINKPIITDNDTGDIITRFISGLINKMSALVIEVGQEKDDIQSIINTINESNSEVVYLPGFLDDYDEISFSLICRSIRNKMIIFGISSMACIKLMSEVIYRHAIVLDVEAYMHFEEDFDYWCGEYYEILMDYKDAFDKDRYNSVYEEHLKLLVSKNLLGVKIALDFSKILSIYFDVLESENIGRVIKQMIINACSFDAIEEKEKNKILSQSGLV